MKYLSDKCEISQYSLQRAAEHCSLNILKWLYYEPLYAGYWSLTTSVCSYAAYGGKIETVKWLREIGCPWDAQSCSYAAENGQLDTLKYLHENGCPWDSDTCGIADENDHLDVLKYLHENSCPCTKRTCTYCKKRNIDH